MSNQKRRVQGIEHLLGSLPAVKRELLAELLDPTPEPIAVVGMACRFPGADSPEAYWRLLEQGIDTVREIPADRWDVDSFYDEHAATPGKMCTREGAFLDQIDQFDAQFFGIAPREAARMDPQQRLLLEVSWEALERAGLSCERLEGSDTGVFVGMATTDYWWLQIPDVSRFDGHAGMGGAHCIATGRLSHFLDLQGPNVAIDTACSSSLVAVHLACQSLRTGESRVALAGGVNVMAFPHATVFLSQWGALAPDGRCKTFDAAANGFGRGEGCGMVVLKRYSDAVAENDPILGLIHGTAINQDGRSTRLSAPNGLSQQKVIRKALADARLQPNEVSYVETHGTGTPLGDPIEVEALVQVLGEQRTEQEICAFGSAKTNVGHLEAAAGVAGLMKSVLSLQHETIPRNPHLKQLNPAIHLDGKPFVIPTENRAWPRSPRPRYAGISSFGLSGTNAHVILGETPAPSAAVAPVASDGSTWVLPLSARSENGLRAVVERYREYFQSDAAAAVRLCDVAYTASVRRTHHPYRTLVAGRTRDEIVEHLTRLLDQPALCERPVFANDSERVVWVFSGQGSQWAGMGRSLLAGEPICRDVIQECDAILREFASWSLVEQLELPEGESRLDETEVAQPAIFAIQAAIALYYEHFGIEPDAVVGHSAGEIAAAYAAGALSLRDALRVIFHRARLMQRATGQGRMAAVGLTETDTQQALREYSNLCVAAVNGPTSTVVSGDAAELARLLAALEQRGVFAKDLGVNYAFHSSQMDGVLDELGNVLRDLQLRPLTRTMISTVTGTAITADQLTAEHWVRNIRQPVRFADAIGELLQDDQRIFIEIGPHPVLASPLRQCATAHGVDAVQLGSLRQGQDEPSALRKALGHLHVAGCQIDWSRGFQADGDGQRPRARCVDLPTYPWQHQRYWLDIEPPSAQDFTGSFGSGKAAAVSEPAEEGEEESLSAYYDRVSTMPDQDESDSFLTFAPFMQKIPDFSWLLTFHDPDNHLHEAELIRQAQKQLRDVLFRGVDFGSLRAALDFGCGYGSDILSLAGKHAHLRLDGYTISPKQAAIGNRKVRERGYQDRVSIYHRDSSQDEFPGQYDLVFGFEVAHYIKDKHLLFSNIDRHLNDGGFVVLADFVANTVSQIDHDATNSFIITLEQWVQLLAEYKLRLVENVDVSQEMSNFLHDPNSSENLSYLAKLRGGEMVRNHFSSYDGLGRLFEKKLATYALMLIQKDPYLSKQEIIRINRERLRCPTPYAEVIERDGVLSTSSDSPSPVGASQLSQLSQLAQPATPRLQPEWLYEPAWRPAPLAAPSNGNGSPRTWLLLQDQQGVGAKLAETLRHRGDTVVAVTAGSTCASLGREHFEIRPDHAEDYRELLADALTSDMPECRAVVNLWPLDGVPAVRTTLRSLETEQTTACESLLYLTQAVSSVDWKESPRVWTVTRNARAAGEGASPPLRVASAAVWGLGRTIALEQPRLWGGLIDLAEATDPASAAEQVVGDLKHGDGENEIAWRNGQRLAARIVRASEAVTGLDEGPALQADATYVLSGGLGDLALEVVRHLAQRGVRHFALLQRSEIPNREDWARVEAGSPLASKLVLLNQLETTGTTVRTFRVDVSDEAQVTQALAEIRRTMPPIRGVVHTAGVLDDGVLSQLDGARLRRVLAAKTSGAWNLHQHTLSDNLDFFVLFSSAASLLGSPGQANYSAANAGLDGLAHLRRQLGLPAISINWGPWSEVGMAAADAVRGARVAEMGIAGIAPSDGVQCLERLLASERPQLGVVAMDVARLQKALPAAAATPLLAELSPGGAGRPAVAPHSSAPPPVAPPSSATTPPPATPPPATTAPPPPAPAAPTPPTATNAAPGGSPRSNVLAAEPAQRRRLLEQFLKSETSQVLQLAISDVDVRQPLNRMGIDSLMAIELRNRIESEFAVTVQMVQFLEGANLAALATSILEQLPAAGDDSSPGDTAEVLAQIDQMSEEEIQKLLAEKKQHLAK